MDKKEKTSSDKKNQIEEEQLKALRKENQEIYEFNQILLNKVNNDEVCIEELQNDYLLQLKSKEETITELKKEHELEILILQDELQQKKKELENICLVEYKNFELKQILETQQEELIKSHKTIEFYEEKYNNLYNKSTQLIKQYETEIQNLTTKNNTSKAFAIIETTKGDTNFFITKKKLVSPKKKEFKENINEDYSTFIIKSRSSPNRETVLEDLSTEK